jgi:hypothetical protein
MKYAKPQVQVVASAVEIITTMQLNKNAHIHPEYHKPGSFSAGAYEADE